MSADPNRVQAVFLAAVELPDADARVAFLDRECGSDAALRDRVERLLVAHRKDSFLGPPVGAAAPAVGDASGTVALSGGGASPRTFGTHAYRPDSLPTGDHAPDSPTGTFGYSPARREHPSGVPLGIVIAGRYTLVEVIGEGGMGTVFRATQTEPVKREVALKLIKMGMDSRAVLARFDAERQALALMDHPNIARIFDGGLTPMGQPFFVMEMVQGVPLTDYCDTHRLTVDARLRLFVQVCNAVQHAHQKGIIHRDLKPGNVLVAEVDGRPTPKVIDFGVAKATEQTLTDMSLAETGAIVGTLAYMSPEQADPSSMDIDTRSDVYALGVMLYELLAGSPPIDAAQFRRGGVLEMLRMVREVEPPKPSTRLSAADALPNIAASRSTDPAKLAKLLRGELDWVVMKALEKDRTRRYESATAFARDIERYLADEVVEARPPSTGYRLRKLVTRNKVQVLAGSLVLLSLVVGVVVSAFFAVLADDRARAAVKSEGEARKAEADAKEARAAAEREAKDAKWQARLANDAKHAIQIDLALRAREDKEYDRVAALLGEMRPEYQDAWETRYVRTLWRRETPLRVTLAGHTDIVVGVAFSPDGTRIVTASGDKTARVWDAATGQEKAVLKGHTDKVESVVFSSDGTRIVTGSWDQTARVWDAVTGREKAVLKGHTDKVYSVAFSPDGTRVVTASEDKMARVWDTATGQEKAVLKGHTDVVVGVAFSPDGTRIVTAGEDNTARLWDAGTGQEKAVLKGHTDLVAGVAFSPDGTRVVTASWDQTARLWDAATGQEKAVLKGHTGKLWRVAFSPDGTRVVTASWDQTARVWDPVTGQEKAVLKGHTGVLTSVAFSRDGSRIVTGSMDRAARVWDATTGQEQTVLKGHTNIVVGVAFSPDGTCVLTGSHDQTARLWDAGTGQDKAALKGHTDMVGSVVFSPDGTRVVTGSMDKTARVWDAATGQEKVVLKGHTDAVGSVAFSPDGTRIVTASGDKTARLWDAATGQEKAVLKGHTGALASVAFSPDGTRIVTASEDKTARVWDPVTGQEKAVLTGHTGMVHGVAFSPDGTRVVTGSADKTPRVWDVATGQEKAVLKGHTDMVGSVAFSPDGTRIVTGSMDQTARVWDPVTGQEKAVLKGHTGMVHGVAFSPDGTRVLTGSMDQTARVWDAEPGREMRRSERPRLPVAPPAPPPHETK